MVEIDIKRIWKNIIKNRWKNAKKSGRKNEGRNKYRNNREVNSEDRLSTISMDFSWTVHGRTNMKSSVAVASFIHLVETFIRRAELGKEECFALISWFHVNTWSDSVK